MASSPIRHPDFESMQRTVRSLTMELLSAYEELALLYSMSSHIGRLTDEHQVAALALQKAIEISSADCGWIAFWDREHGQMRERCRIGIAPATIDAIHNGLLVPMGHSDRPGVVLNALPRELDIPDASIATRFLASPLLFDGKLFGYLCLGREPERPVFLSPDQKLIAALAHLATAEIENVRLRRSEFDRQGLLRELRMAHSIQQSLLPREVSEFSFLESAGVSEPCSEVGGDFFELVRIDSATCLMMIADVVGKGPPAALKAAMLQGILIASSQSCDELPNLMSMLNECLLKSTVPGHFVTAFAATLAANGQAHYSNAGHSSALWVRGLGDVVELTQGGPLLGVFSGTRYPQGAIQLADGDLLVMYTDGISDARSEQGECFGSLRLLEWGRTQHGHSAKEVRDSLLLTVNEFTGAGVQRDDRSALVVRYISVGS